MKNRKKFGQPCTEKEQNKETKAESVILTLSKFVGIFKSKDI